MSKEQPDALRLADQLDSESVTGRVSNHTGRKSAVELRRLHAENEALRAQIGQGVPTDEQIMATVQQKGFGFSQSRPLAQQWDQVCELIRAVVRERNTHPAPQQIGQGEPVAEIEITRNKRTGELESYRFSKTPKDAPAGTYSVYTHPAPQAKAPHPAFAFRECEDSQAGIAPQAGEVQQEPTLTTCNCRWDGEKQVQQCTLHEAHIDAIHEWAERAKTAEAKLVDQQAKPQPLTDEQIEAIYTQETGSLIDDSPWALVDFVRAIEAAHNIGEKK